MREYEYTRQSNPSQAVLSKSDEDHSVEEVQKNPENGLGFGIIGQLVQEQPSLANAKAALTSGFKGLFKKVMDQANIITQTVTIGSNDESFTNVFENVAKSM